MDKVKEGLSSCSIVMKAGASLLRMKNKQRPEHAGMLALRRSPVKWKTLGEEEF